jgi:hypothetical protein
MKPKKPYHPTKQRPHPWCGTLHLLGALNGLIVIADTMYYAPWSGLIFFVLMMIIGWHTVRAAWKGKSLTDLAIEDAASQGSGSAGNMSSRHLIVRPVWANLAIGMDLLQVLAGSTIAWHVITKPGSGDYSVPAADITGILVIGLSCTFIWFWQYAHRKATEPAKPLRLFVRVPVKGGA